MCRPSPRRRGSPTTTTAPPLQQQQGSIDQSIDENGNEDDIQAVKSWREKKRTLPPLPSSSSLSASLSSNALVVFDSNQRKLATIEEGTNDSRNTSLSVSPSLTAATPSKIVEDMITAIPPLSPIENDHKNHDYEQQQQLVAFTGQEAAEGMPQYNRSITNHQFQSLSVNSENGLYDDNEVEKYHEYHQHRNDSAAAARYGGGGFPTLSPQEEEWRKEQHDYLLAQQLQQQRHQDDDFLSSSSSNSTIEDPILIHTSKDEDDSMNHDENMKRTNSGPIDLDDEHEDDGVFDTMHNIHNYNGKSNQSYNPIDNYDGDILSSSFLSSSSSSKRPGPDDADIERPIASYKSPKHHTKSSGSTFGVNSSMNSDDLNTNTIVSKQEKSQSSSSSILRDKEPELYTINNSAESEELDAMIAAIDSSGSDNKIPSIPVPTKTKDSVSRSMMNRSNRNSQSSPTLHLTVSQQSSPSVHSGSRNSVPSIKLSPSRRDSPSVHDPASYIVSHDEYNSNSNITREPETMNHNAPVRVSPSSDGSASVEPNATAATPTVVTMQSRRGRSTNTQPMQPQPQFINASTMQVVTIPETAQQRRKARSQSRGRRIRERARTLLSSYNTSKNESSDHTTSEPQRNETPGPLSIPPIIQPVTMENGSDSMGWNSSRGIENDRSTLLFVDDSRSQNNTNNGSVGLSTTRSLNYGSNLTNLPGDNAFNQYTIRPSEMDHSDRLSDIPSEIDPMLRERYLKACRILKSSLLEKDATMRPSDKAFLSQLLLETTPSKDDSDSNDFLTEEKVKLYESTVHNTLLERSTPLFDTATTVVTTTDDFSGTTSDVNNAANTATGDNRNIYTTASGESSGVTEHELQIHNYVMNHHYSTTDTLPSKVKQINTISTTAASQVSSSVFSRVDDDYPYKVLGLDGSRRSTVLLPWMMHALRGFFPLEISNHNFWLKYQLDRNTDINHEDNVNLMTLLSKIQHDTYTILCVETVDGHVFGAFCTAPWEFQSSWYGSGDSSFLWRLKHPRRGGRNDGNESNENTDDRNMNEIEIYPYTRYDSFVQYCSSQTLAVGGGTDWTLTKEGYSPYHHPPTADTPQQQPNDESTATGIGFLLDGDLMGGETNSCVTYANPPLGKSSDSKNIEGANEFDIQTLEVYTFTNFASTQEATTKG